MVSKDDALAEELMRSYNYVRRFVGVRWEDDEGSFVLSQPTYERADQIARIVLAEAPSRADVAAAIGAREVVELSAGHLGKAWFHLGKLEQRDRLRALVEEGVRPLRSLRGVELDAQIATFRAALENAQGPRSGRGSGLLERLFEDGEQIRDAFVAAQRADESAAQRRAKLLDELVDTAERVATGRGPATRALRPLWEQLAKLPVAPIARSRALVGVFRSFAGGSNPHELGRRRTLEAAVRDLPLVEAARALAALATPADPEPSAALEPREREQLLELAILLRGTGLRLPRGGGERLVCLLDIARDLEVERLEAVWGPLLDTGIQALRSARWVLRETQLPGPMLARALHLDVLGCLDQFESEHGARAYLDAVARLRANPIPNVQPTADWFLAPFQSGRSWEPTFVLGLLAAHRSEPQTLVSMMTAIRAAGVAELSFVDAIVRWNDPFVEERPPEWDALGELLDLSVSQLERYVHWRRIAGYGETFSSAVRNPVELAAREERELEHLRARAASPAIVKRLAALEDPAARAERLGQAARRARNAFDRALEVLERESLDAVLDATARAAFERLLGRRLDARLPRRIRSLMFLVGAPNLDLDAVRDLLEDLLAGRAPPERDANRRWLTSMAGRGLDARRWLEGVHATIEVRGEALEFTTERDPLHVLEMGSYFDTCLSLDGGFNAASTLTNAIDVNKQVIYGRRADGTVVARKLIAATNDGKLLGYRTYAFADQPIVETLLGQEIARFAAQCGLELGASGRPAALHDTFWYDDGVERWHGPMSLPLTLPADIPADEAAHAEWMARAGFEDSRWWVQGAMTHFAPWAGACAGRAWMAGAGARTVGAGDEWLAAHGEFAWILDVEDAHPWQVLTSIGPCLPGEPAAMRRLLDTLRRARRAAGWGELEAVPSAVACLDPPEVAAFAIEHVRLARDAGVECVVDRHADCLARWTEEWGDVLHASLVRCGGGDLDALLVHRDPLVRDIAVEVCSRVPVEGAAKRLRAIFKQDGPDGRIEWALARQGDDASVWLLRSAGCAPTDPRTAARLARIDALYGPTLDADAIVEADERDETHRLGTLAFAFDAARCEAIVGLLSKPRSYGEALNLRHLLPFASGEALARTFVLQGSWESIRALGPDLERWRTYVGAVAAQGQTANAVWRAGWASAVLAPAVSDAFVAELLDAHESAMVRDRSAILEFLTSGGAYGAGSYRALEIFLGWLAERVDEDRAPPRLTERFRGEWATRKWSELRVPSG